MVLRHRLAHRGIVDRFVQVEGASAFVTHPAAIGPVPWESLAGEISLATAPLPTPEAGWRAAQGEPRPVLELSRQGWHRFVRELYQTADPSWFVERAGRNGPGRSVLQGVSSLRWLARRRGSTELRLFAATESAFPFGRGWGVRIRVVDRPTPGPGVDPAVPDAAPFPIDVVYTWVDDADPAWRSRRQQTLLGERPAADAAGDERFHSHDELRYSMRSVEYYAPWVRHIYVVTDRQVPEWLDVSSDRVTVVDHREIIDAAHLPTFNSHVIEANLHRIGGLAEQYVYFNDDVFLGRSVGWQTFFDGEGRARFFPSPTEVPTGSTADLSIDAATTNGRRLVAARFGTDAKNKMRHTPHPQRRAVHEWMETEFATEREVTLGAPFRSMHDQSFASFLHHYVGEQLGLVVRGDIWYDYVGLAEEGLELRFRSILRRTDPFDAFCLNDASVEPDTRAAVDRMVTTFLRAAYPFPAVWETSRPSGA